MVHQPPTGDMMLLKRPRRPRRSGATLVESALVLNIFFLLVFGIFEFGRLLMTRHLIANAARGAARMASSGTDVWTKAQIIAEARRLLVGQLNDPTTIIDVYRVNASGSNIGAWDDAAFGEGIAVQIDGDYRTMIPTFGILRSTYHLKALSIMRSEGD